MFLPLIVCFTLFNTFLDIQFVPEPESSNVLTLKYLPLLPRTGIMIVGHIETSASFEVLIIWMVGIMGSFKGIICWELCWGLSPCASHA